MVQFRTKKEAIYEILKLDLSKQAFSLKEYKKFADYNLKFHMYLYEKSDNSRLTNIIESLWRNTKRYPPIFDQNDDYIKISIDEHEEIYSALLSKNSALAEELMKKHKLRAAKAIIKLAQEKYG